MPMSLVARLWVPGSTSISIECERNHAVPGCQRSPHRARIALRSTITASEPGLMPRWLSKHSRPSRYACRTASQLFLCILANQLLARLRPSGGSDGDYPSCLCRQIPATSIDHACDIGESTIPVTIPH